MLKIIWDDNIAVPVVDSKIHTFVNVTLNSKYDFCYVAQTALIDAFRLAIREGRINHEEVVFVYEGEEFEIDEKGYFHEYPFPDVNMEILGKLI
jgi:hypothetical protein